MAASWRDTQRLPGLLPTTTVARFTQGIIEDVLAVAEVPAALQPRRFAQDALRRFANPTLRHACVQVGADGSRKLPLRFGSVVSERRRRRALTGRGLPPALPFGWRRLLGIEVLGEALPSLDDPEASRLAVLPHRDLHRITRLALGDHFDESFPAEVAEALGRLTQQGLRLLEDVS